VIWAVAAGSFYLVVLIVMLILWHRFQTNLKKAHSKAMFAAEIAHQQRMRRLQEDLNRKIIETTKPKRENAYVIKEDPW
jgi:ABC-type lipoprotein release transport system permease subunit